MSSTEPIVELKAVTKDYRGLRPLRVQHLALHMGQSLALLGFDQPSAEVMVNLITGAILPDSGEVRVFGQPTSTITDPDTWVHTLDQIGLISERAVMLDQLTVEQNLAMPLTLALDAVPEDVRGLVAGIAAETGLSAAQLHHPVTSLDPLGRLRLRLGRALVLAPRLLLAEHPNALLPASDVPAIAADIARVASLRGLASMVLTADATFAGAAAADVLTWYPATGELKRGGWRRWFS